jgi:anti-anti-sigma factor
MSEPAESGESRLEVFHSRSDDSEVISCDGWVDIDTCHQLQRLLDAAFEEGVQRLRLDLWHVRGIDEAGLDCLIQTSERCRRAGAMLEFEPSREVQEAMAAAGITEQFAA